MGILNLTPDSFSDGRPDAGTSEFLARADAIISEGAAILDIGGESTRPGASAVAATDELARVLPFLEAFRSRHPRFPISLDTTKYEVARAAAAYDVAVLNDVSCLADVRLAALARDQGGAYVLMHSRGTPQTMSDMTDYPTGVLDGIWAELESRIKKIKELGLATNNLWIDPGFGFAKTPAQCLELATQLDLWRGFRDRVWPRARLMIGVSRKRFLQSDANQPWERDEASLRVALNAVEHGFSVVRTHNVALTVAALRRY